MKKSFYLAAAAALLMATGTAHAGSGISFEIGGQKVHIDAPKNCSSLSCVSVTNNGSAVNLKNMKGKNSGDDDVATNNSPTPAPQPPAAPAVQAPPPAPVANTAPPAPPAPVANYAPPAPPAPVADASHERLSGLPAATNDNPPRATNTAPAYTAPANPAPVANNAPPAQHEAPVAAPPAVAANSPLGLWATEDNKGNVRIEQCGANLCGFSEHNDPILINMKPYDNKWVGRIHDPESNSNYDSNITLKGPNILKVQGCAFGGMFCGGQTWKRVS